MKRNITILLASLFAISLTAQVTPAPALAPAPAPVVGPGAAPAPALGPGATQATPAPALGPGATNQVVTTQPPANVNPTNVDYTNQIMYMDEMGQPKTARLNAPPMVQAGSPPLTVQFTIYNGSGMIMGTMFDGFRYRGDNGAGYETRVVLMQTGDPNRPYEARFQSSRIGGMEFHEGRVIILDWQNTPWVVKPEYTNDRGIIFKFHPFREGE